MDAAREVIYGAAAVWEQALLGLTWYHGVIAVAYLGVAWLCLLNAYIAQTERDPHRVWYMTALLLSLLAINTLLRADVFVTHGLRGLARVEGWYGVRRPLQYLAEFVVALVLLFLAGRLRRELTAGPVQSESVAFGLALLLLLLAVRTVSAHGTDAIMNFYLAGVSVGRWLELGGIALILQGALHHLRLR
jgi:hypothetical protein